MNEFTKEELEYLLAIMKPLQWLWQEAPLKLESKVQSMIDNYCEHEHKQYYERVNIYECNDCHRVTLAVVN